MSASPRLSWKCRRGTLELDIILQRFLAQVYPELPPQACAIFEQLVESGDEELWALINGHVSAPNVEAQYIIERLRAC